MKGEPLMVPKARFRSYYGRPVVKAPTWSERDIAGYLFLGGLSAGSAMLAAGGDATGLPALRRAGRFSAFGAIALSAVALVHDLGRPGRFVNMLRVVKPTSPMSVGSWLLAGYGPLTGLAAAGELADHLPLPARVRRALPLAGSAAGVGAAALGSLVATYTAVLLADTAVPTWHEARRQLPVVFAGSAASAAGGLAAVLVPVEQAGPARRFALVGTAVEVAAEQLTAKSIGLAGETMEQGRAGRLLRLGRWAGVGGVALLGTYGERNRFAAVLGGLSLVAGSALTRFGFFAAGVASAEDPKYTVMPQRERLDSVGR